MTNHFYSNIIATHSDYVLWRHTSCDGDTHSVEYGAENIYDETDETVIKADSDKLAVDIFFSTYFPKDNTEDFYMGNYKEQIKKQLQPNSTADKLLQAACAIYVVFAVLWMAYT
jgi:hypothetical protein